MPETPKPLSYPVAMRELLRRVTALERKVNTTVVAPVPDADDEPVAAPSTVALDLGVVSAIHGPQATVNVLLGGDTISNLPYLNSYEPYLWEYVVVATLTNPGAYGTETINQVVLGALGPYNEPDLGYGGDGDDDIGARVFVQSSEPAGAVTGDLWVQT